MPLPGSAVILVVEDLENDVILIRTAFERAGVTNPVFVVRDGEEAQAYLEGVGKYSHRDEYPLPDLMLLDIKMPKVDGFELLKWIRANDNFRALRVVVLTASDMIYDVNKAYELGANSFLVKPFEFEHYPAMMRTLGSFWLKDSVPPKIERPKDGPKPKDENGRGK